MRPRLYVCLFLFTVGAFAVAASPGEWPQWRGPDRTGISKETGLLKTWPEGGPKLLWKVTGLGHGYATVSVANGKIYTLGTKGAVEYVRCLAEKDGKEQWATELGKEVGTGGMSYPAPRSTPTVDGDLVFGLSSDGKLACLKADSGDVVWKKDLMADFGGNRGFWAYAESPLVDGDRLICTPGGDSATLVCLEKKTGKEVWRASAKGLKAKAPEFGKGGKDKGKGGKGGKGGFGKGGFGKGGYSQAGYASAMTADIGGTKQYVQYVSGGVIGVDAKTGKLLWHYDDVGGGQSTLTPIIHDDSVFVSQTKVGSGRAKVSSKGEKLAAEQVYFVNEVRNHHGGMVLVDGHVYGTSDVTLVCMDFKTGKVKWSNRGVGKGSIVYADGHLIVRGERGDVALVEANPAEYKEKGRFKQPDRSDKSAWAHPVIAGGKLYLRDWDTLLCYDIKEK